MNAPRRQQATPAPADQPHRVTATLDASTVEALDALAARLGGATRSAAIRYAVALGIAAAFPQDGGGVQPGAPSLL